MFREIFILKMQEKGISVKKSASKLYKLLSAVCLLRTFSLLSFCVSIDSCVEIRNEKKGSFGKRRIV